MDSGVQIDAMTLSRVMMGDAYIQNLCKSSTFLVVAVETLIQVEASDIEGMLWHRSMQRLI